MYTSIFDDEIELILDDSYKEFAIQAINEIEDDYYSQIDVKQIKSVVKYSRALASVLEPDDRVLDMYTIASLLHLYCRFDTVEMERDLFYMLRVRGATIKFQSIIGREEFNNIMLLIESQGGYASPVPHLEPRLDATAFEWILPFSIQLARMENENDTA